MAYIEVNDENQRLKQLVIELKEFCDLIVNKLKTNLESNDRQRYLRLSLKTKQIFDESNDGLTETAVQTSIGQRVDENIEVIEIDGSDDSQIDNQTVAHQTQDIQSRDRPKEMSLICGFSGCGKQFKSNYLLNRHKAIHITEKPFKCPAKNCIKRFKRRDHLGSHLKRKHPNRSCAEPVNRPKSSQTAEPFRKVMARQQPKVKGQNKPKTMSGFPDVFADHNRKLVYNQMKEQMAREGKPMPFQCARDVNIELGKRWQMLSEGEKNRYRVKQNSKAKLEECDDLWLRRAIAPDSVTRPKRYQEKGFFYFFSCDNQNNLDPLWKTIGLATRKGYLGYCAAYSDSSQVIAIHSANSQNIPDLKRIESNLIALGVNVIHFKTKYVSDDKNLKNDLPLELSPDDHSFWEGLNLTGKLVTEEEFKKRCFNN